ncbi:hypothetical protein PV326_010265 [Microctonus aethiopoides]|nr:hypothetical protein PV326_010265 [Microctonus aethiopoides]
MGWPIKGSERSYDSLSGTADIIGAEAMEPKTAALLVDKCNLLLKSYKILNKCTSVAIRNKMIISNISFNNTKDTYKESDGIARLFGADENGRIHETKTKKIILL